MGILIITSIISIFVLYVGFIVGTVRTDLEWQKMNVSEFKRVQKIQTGKTKPKRRK